IFLGCKKGLGGNIQGGICYLYILRQAFKSNDLSEVVAYICAKLPGCGADPEPQTVRLEHNSMVGYQLVYSFLVTVANIGAPLTSSVPENSCHLSWSERVVLQHKLLEAFIAIHRSALVLLLKV